MGGGRGRGTGQWALGLTPCGALPCGECRLPTRSTLARRPPCALTQTLSIGVFLCDCVLGEGWLILLHQGRG